MRLIGGVVAGGAAVLAMAGTATAGVLLLDAGGVSRVDQLAATVVGMAVGAPVVVGMAPGDGLPVAVHGRLDVMPLGVSLVGAVVLGVLLLRRGREGLLVRGGVAAVVFAAGIGAVARVGRGSLGLPAGGASAAVEARGCLGSGGLSSGGGLLGGGLPGGGRLLGGDSLTAGFSVAVGTAVAGAAGLALAVVAVCWLCGRFPAAATALRALRWPAVAVGVACLVAGWAFGGPAAAGGVLLALPLVLSGTVLLGLGVPWTVHAGGVLSCVLDGGPNLPTGGWLAAVSAVVLLGSAVAVAAGANSAVAVAAGANIGVPAGTNSGLAVAAETDRDRVGGWLRRAAGLALRFALVTGVALAVLALLSRASAQLGAQAFIVSVPLLDLRLAANPWLALAAGLGAGAVAGFAGSLLARGFVSWRP